jgi:hypothetical protein
LKNSKKQVASSVLNILQSTEFIDQEKYNDYSSKINMHFDYSDYLSSFSKLHEVQQEIDKSLTDGNFHFKDLKDKDEKKLARLKRFKSSLVIVGVLVNIFGISIGAYFSQMEKVESDKEIKLLLNNNTNELKEEIINKNTLIESSNRNLIERMGALSDTVVNHINNK